MHSYRWNILTIKYDTNQIYSFGGVLKKDMRDRRSSPGAAHDFHTVDDRVVVGPGAEVRDKERRLRRAPSGGGGGNSKICPAFVNSQNLPKHKLLNSRSHLSTNTFGTKPIVFALTLVISWNLPLNRFRTWTQRQLGLLFTLHAWNPGLGADYILKTRV